MAGYDLQGCECEYKSEVVLVLRAGPGQGKGAAAPWRVSSRGQVGRRKTRGTGSLNVLRRRSFSYVNVVTGSSKINTLILKNKELTYGFSNLEDLQRSSLGKVAVKKD